MSEDQIITSYSQYLDDNLYAPLEFLSGLPYQLRFSRVGNMVFLQEGPYISTILEKRSYSRDASWFSFQISFLNHGIEDAGWMLRSKASFFLVYCPYCTTEGGDPTMIRAMLIPRQRLFLALEACGFNRAILAGRADLIRRGGKGGIFRTADPDIFFNFRAEGERRPVEVRIQTPVLEKIAAGDFTIPIEGFQEPLKGKWLGREIFVERGIKS